MITISSLTCGYGKKNVLHDVDLEIKGGEIFGVIGPNGCGKTTLLRAACGEIHPAFGEVFLEGENIKDIKLKCLAGKIAVVPQHTETGHITAEEFVLLGRIPHYRRFQFFETGNDIGIAEECMRMTDTLHVKEKDMSAISGGERQLVCIARALAQEPRLLLLDEPTAHLDIRHQVKILDLIRKLNRERGVTVVIVLHDLNLAGEYCHKLTLISEGRIYRTGTPEEIMDARTIKDVYRTDVIVEKNPISSRPYVVVVPSTGKEGR
ncbi:MAG: ABC transporter ATP-binding protein [Candidatus Omnitrophota bacterium]|nr:ABC transporter ATP-binding protein [Candidatus Omnitrophota bacterium]